MRTGIIAAGALAVLAGCSAPHTITDRSDFLAEGTRTYKGETKERVIEAAQMVLRISDPNDFEFRNGLNGFTGLRRYVIYAILAAAVGREKWEFNVEQPSPTEIRAAVAVSEAGKTTGGYSATPYENEMASIPLYRLFWDRVEYVLGRRSDWVTCEQAAAALQATNTGTAALGGLCGPTSDGRNAPPPPQMQPLVTAPLATRQRSRAARPTPASPTARLRTH